MTDGLVQRLRGRADEWYEMCDDIHGPLNEAADRIEALEAENKRLREITYRYVDPCDVTPEDGAFIEAILALQNADLLEKTRPLSNERDAGQPWLRTYDVHLKVECARCCGNGQTYGPNSGEDIICPGCGGKGRV